MQTDTVAVPAVDSQLAFASLPVPQTAEMDSAPMQQLPSLLLAITLAAPATAQTLTLNTRLRDHVPIPTSNWSSGNTGYRTATNRYLIQTLGTGGLAIVDTTNTSNATVIRTITGISVKEVKVYGNHAYATTDNGPTRVIDLTNPATASVVNSITEGAHTLQVDPTSGRLYLNRSSQNQLRILDLAANPVNPPLLVAHPLPDIHDCNPEGNIVYVSGGSPTTCYILDVSALPTVTQLGSFNVPGGYLHGADLYVNGSGQKFLLTCTELSPQTWMKIYNVTNPAAVSLVSQWWTDQAITIHNVSVKGAYAYVAYYRDGLRILDLSNPAAPQQVGIFDPNGSNAVGTTFTGTWDAYPYHDAIYMDEMYDTTNPNTQGSWVVDFFPGFGSGCPGTGGVIPTQWWSFGPPSPGNTDFALRLEDARPSAPAILVVGYSNTTWNGAPLPADLTLLGAAGCNLYDSAELVDFALTDATGKVAYALPIPLGISGTLWCQWGVIDVGAPNSLLLAMTNGGTLILQ